MISPDALVLGRTPALVETARAALTGLQLIASSSLNPAVAWPEVARQALESSAIVKSELLERLRLGGDQDGAAAFNTLWSSPPKLLVVGAIEPDAEFWRHVLEWHWQILFGATVLLVLPGSAASRPELQSLERQSHVTVVPWDIFSEPWLRKWTETRFNRSKAASLSAQEVAIMRLLAEGKSLPVVAKTLGLTVNTVKKYDARVRAKLDYQGSSAGLVAALIRDRII